MKTQTILNANNPTSKEAYEYFKKNRKFTIKAIDQYNYYRKAIEGIFMTLTDMIEDSQGGVYLEGIGYFCFVIYPTKMKKKGKRLENESLFKRVKKENTYFLYFFPDMEMEDFVLHRDKCEKVRPKRKDYKLHFSICQSYRISKLITKRKKDYRKKDFDYKTQLTTKILQRDDLNTIYSGNRE